MTDPRAVALRERARAIPLLGGLVQPAASALYAEADAIEEAAGEVKNLRASHDALDRRVSALEALIRSPGGARPGAGRPRGS